MLLRIRGVDDLPGEASWDRSAPAPLARGPAATALPVGTTVVALGRRKRLWFTLEHRITYVVMLLLSLPHLIASAGASSTAAVVFVYSALALLLPPQRRRTPQPKLSRRAQLRQLALLAPVPAK